MKFFKKLKRWTPSFVSVDVIYEPQFKDAIVSQLDYLYQIKQTNCNNIIIKENLNDK